VTQKENPAAGDGRAELKADYKDKDEAPSTPQIAKLQTENSAPDAIERRGNWLAIGGDTTGKRIVCKCASCGHVCVIGAGALEGGAVHCPGCAHPPRAKTDARSDSFAGAVANLEGRNAWKRHKGGGGEP
jgi:hypothetical protein